MFIEQLQVKDFTKYDKAVDSYGSIFNSREWLNLFGDNVRIFCIYDNSRRILGGFHISKKKIGFNSILTNPPLTPFIGPFIVNRSRTIYKKNTYRKKVLTMIAERLRKEKASLQIYSLDRHIKNTMPFSRNKFNVWPRYTYRINLADSIENIKAAMSDSRRNDITRANRDSIKNELTQDIEILTNLIEQSSNHKKLDNLELKRKIMDCFVSKHNSITSVSYKNGKPIAAAFCLHDRTTAYYMFSGYDREDRHHGAGPLTIWNCITEAKRRGLKYFDFDGSVVPELENYFRGFGGNLVPFFRIAKINYLLKLGILISGKSLV